MRIRSWLVAAVVLTACTADVADEAPSVEEGDAPVPSTEDVAAEVENDPEVEDDPVRVAAGPDPETALLAEVMVRLLEVADLPAEVVPFPDARDSRQALETGQVDARPGYTGETWLETLERPDPPGDGRESFEAVQSHDAGRGIVWLRPRFLDGLGEPPANATFAFVVAGPPSVDAGLTSVSQLATRLSEDTEATLCVDQDFASRADGLRAVLAAYSVRSDQPVLAAEPDEVVAAVLAGDCVAGLTTATDGIVWAAGLRPLIDDLQVFPAFLVVPQLREDAVEERPGLREALGPLASHLSTQRLGEWNARVAVGEPLEQVAEDAVAALAEESGVLELDLTDD